MREALQQVREKPEHKLDAMKRFKSEQCWIHRQNTHLNCKT